ncbi:hypothetical protein EHO60_16735 [Leptospira fletcheri]|uniref:Uncharacterized protein n=1 Tax=Leptospira fletcheri TaxID=2484981 RepID=A0A4R9G570_9LEPT|nr:hypothetical protein [Leptospira fletcheri]TGK06295.1 hypothetical protein EHO60_16735 [Leptospira fletcheri]
MVLRLFMENFNRIAAYRLAFGWTGLSFLFYFLSQPNFLFLCLGLGFFCLLAGIFFPHPFQEGYNRFRSVAVGIVSFVVSVFLLIGYLLFWRPFLLLKGKREE